MIRTGSSIGHSHPSLCELPLYCPKPDSAKTEKSGYSVAITDSNIRHAFAATDALLSRKIAKSASS